ncbi:conserved hypothetical protein [Ricinus communis]|uniref:Uncharacterized protein n=1 Tax=Ricinus communis TaxID=3988 RepID=B9RX92_RICCO|nr:conserved hypothetical protein [Ricinus communis]
MLLRRHTARCEARGVRCKMSCWYTASCTARARRGEGRTGKDDVWHAVRREACAARQAAWCAARAALLVRLRRGRRWMVSF